MIKYRGRCFKRKKYICMLKPYGEMIKKPFEVEHTENGLEDLTNKHDSITIANFEIDNWFHLKNHESSSKIYSELKFLGRQYRHYMKLRVDSVLGLTYLLDHTMPGIKGVLTG